MPIINYRIAVEHEDNVNPDPFVNAAEMVLNEALRIGLGNRSGSEALAMMMDKLGDVANAMLAVREGNISKEEIKNYQQMLIKLNAISLCTLTSFNYNIEKDKP